MKQKSKPQKRESQVRIETIQPGTSMSDRTMMWLVAAFAFLLYANTLTFQYALDDALVITENSFTKKGISGIKSILTNDSFTGFFGTQKKLVAGGRYRPLSQIMFAIEYQMFGLNPFIGHLINILLYSLLCALLFILLKKIFVQFHSASWYRSLPFIATLIFAAHPIHTEVVANIKGRDEILSLLLSFGVLYFSILYQETKKLYLLAILFITFFLALLAKENSITFLAVIPLVLFYMPGNTLKNNVLILTPLVMATLFYLAARNHALGYLLGSEKINEILNDPYAHSTQAVRMATNIFTWGYYLKLLVLPHPLTHDYYPNQIPYQEFTSPGFIFSFLIFVGMTVVALMGLRKKTVYSFGILFFLITFSISSNLVFNVGTFMNERFVFAPLLGFSLLVAMLIVGLTKPGKDKKQQSPGMGAMTLLIVLLSLYSVKTFSRNFTWKDDFTLFTTDVKTSSKSAKCNVSAGGMYLNKAKTASDSLTKSGLLNQAEQYLISGVRIYPQYSAGWVLLGNVYLERKMYKEASDYYMNALAYNPNQAEALNKLTYVAYKLNQKGQAAAAIRAYHTLNGLQPDNKDHLIQMADQYSKTGRVDTALIIVNNLLAKYPDYAAGYSKLGEISGRVFNDIPKAEAYLTKAYELDAKSTSTLENLAIVYGIKKEYARSLEFFNKALALDSLNPRILMNTANTYRMMGNMKMAESFAKKSAIEKSKQKD